MNRKKIFIVGILITLIITIISFTLSDNPDNKYLNPAYIDILALISGFFLIITSFSSIKYKTQSSTQFILNLITATIGTSILTIHVLQFLFDFFR